MKKKNSLTFDIVHSKVFFPHNWFHAVAVTFSEGENQILFKSTQQMVYVSSEMTVKVSKCHSFGIYKKGTTSTQYKLNLYLDVLYTYLQKTSVFFPTAVWAIAFKSPEQKSNIRKQSTRDVLWKIIFPKLEDTPTKIKMTPSINFFWQGDLL